MELETFRWLLTDDGQALLRQATELVDAGSVPLRQDEMDLVDMKGVRLRRAILDYPILNVSLANRDIRLGRVRIKRYRSLTIHREHKYSGASGRAGVLRPF